MVSKKANKNKRIKRWLKDGREYGRNKRVMVRGSDKGKRNKDMEMIKKRAMGKINRKAK